ncbi:DUF4129 domain-containing protein [Actinokineospora enzanensis]|uniref:DUF4129 domain-containing protein n=1 Tax=Actinokineospora enzanensis TaxID=155975 RepID=UPI00036C5849|nr:DUF4129 domain-containing protein [Actinokineospora enzanensis]
MPSRLPPPLVVTALLVLAVVAARGESAIPTGTGDSPRPDPAPAPVATPAEPVDRHPVLDLISGLSAGVLLLVVAAMLVVGLAGILAALAGVRRRRVRLALPEAGPVDLDAPADGTATARALAGAAHTARLKLSEHADGVETADAIIAAWLVLERAAAGLGTPRAPHQTPTEFTAVVLAEHDADADALADLRGVYQRARFGRANVITQSDVLAAIDALNRVERSLVISQ